MTKRFTPKARKVKPIAFQIDNAQTGTDDEYTFTPPKLAEGMLPVLEGDGDGEGMTTAVWQWLRNGLGDDQYAHLRGRLTDPDDHLDVEQVAEITQWLVGEATGRPTGKRSGS